MATHSLTLTIGSTTISLVSGNSMLLSYVPASPPVQVQQIQKAGDGALVYGVRRQTVKEQARVYINGTTGADVQNTIRDIERFFALCERRQVRKMGDRGYVNLQLSSDTETWRSEILTGSIQPDRSALRYWANNGTEALITWERVPFWEGTEREIALSNGNGTNVTGGIVVYNHDDGDAGHDNWVDLDTGDVLGNVPTAPRIELVNNNGINISSRHFYLAASNSPGFPHVLEGEAAIGVQTIADSGSSSGNYGRNTWTGGAIPDTVNMFNWTLSSALVAAAGGDYFRALVRFVNAPATTTSFRLRVKIPSGVAPLTTLWESEKIQSTGQALQDLGNVPIPPGIPTSQHNEVALVLGINTTATSGNLDIDFLMLLPSKNMRHFVQAGYQVQANDKVIDDGILDRVYGYDALTSLEWSIYGVRSNPVMLMPGEAQRIYLLHDESTGSPNMNISRQWKMSVFYRPRRLSL